uniref:Uncharacterized protein n=1 Tax=viral metagenome TaxID=1070528 RepID=A0A6C0E631_9ZZZZ
MDDKAKLQLNQMIRENNVTDQTELIRSLKHSSILRNNINDLIMLKAKYSDNEEQLHLEAMHECNFLFTYYTDIYNKIRKDEIDIKILFQFLEVLKKIEDGELDQHEGSFEVGTLLKKIYVDSALRKAEKLNKPNQSETDETVIRPQVNISWKTYKKTHA